MRRNTIVAAASLLVFGAGAAVGASDTQIATTGTAALETLVDTDFDATWDGLVNELAGRDYEINALIKQDRTIRVLFQSETPARYVDCGDISVISTHKVFGDRKFNFPAASSVRYLVVDENVDELVDVERRTSLNALANIHLTPMGRGTMVRIEAMYVMKIKTREFAAKVATRDADDSVNFDSAGRASKTEDIRQGATSKAVTFECKPTGALERKIASTLGNNS